MATGQRVIQVPRGWAACVTMAAAVFLAALGLSGSMLAAPAPPQAAPASAFPGPTDVDFFRKNIEPMFMRDRGGTMPGYAACVMCHTWQTSLRFRLETPATDAGWTAEQSRRNFEFVTRVVDTAAPESSRLLVKPLAVGAGGMGHTGGTFWKSREDPEYQMVLKWIRSLPANRYVAARAAPAGA